MSDDGKEKLQSFPPAPLIETKIFYYIDDQEPPYLTKLCQQQPVKLKDFKNALDRNCSKYKFFFMSSDNTIGKVKEEIINDDQILPYADNGTDRIVAYLVSIEGSTTSGGDRSSTASGEKHQHKQRIIDDDTLTTTTNSSSFIQQPRLQRNSRRYHSGASQDHRFLIKQQRQHQDSSFPSSDLDTTTFLDETEDDRYSTITDSTAVSSRYHGRNRQRRRKHRLPIAIDRASSFSSLNSDSTMTLNIITVTLNLDSVNFLGISIVGQSDKNGTTDGGIYVGSIMKGGAVAHDGRIEPGDMILQVNDISFEKLSNDDAVKILREAVQKPGPIKLVVAKCWDTSPRGYFTLPRHEQARPVDPLSWLAHTQAISNTFNPTARQSLLHQSSTTNMSSTISSTGNTLTDNERFGLDLNLTVDSDMDTILRAMAEKDSGLDIRDRFWLKMPIPRAFLGSDLVNWLFEHVEGFIQRNDARKYASSMLKAGYIRHTVNKLTFSEQCYYVFGDLYAQGISQLTLDEEPEDYESVSENDRDTLAPLKPATYGYLDKNNTPLYSPQQTFHDSTLTAGITQSTHSNSGGSSCSKDARSAKSSSTSSTASDIDSLKLSSKQQHHPHQNSLSNNSRQLESVPNQLRSSKESFLQAMAHPCEFFVDVM
ncbi:unnamed protein product [Didymodactylos carnosus]|uniref:Dishevelled n=1 Tax=Didymodactylos carnosus TaxID=1234261 RepID=A0A814D0A3_9BILA|nr:unnamed protein product [Didymodactylos carnosus]CAF0994148.1 unnamed protein product [Didymodactylos carnosus]CAF3723556.1 unnamed protein product [Didymodactylos carnosus]CAF3763939.1 unnamed protein product [Didymodactylos carnosus]